MVKKNKIEKVQKLPDNISRGLKLLEEAELDESQIGKVCIRISFSSTIQFENLSITEPNEEDDESSISPARRLRYLKTILGAQLNARKT